jgi:hypothetical protein
MSIEVILTDRNNQRTTQSFGSDLKAASKVLVASWKDQTHKEGEIRKNGEVLMQFGYS